LAHSPAISRNLFEGGFEVFNGFLGKNVKAERLSDSC
jgi:hypothetical protein